MKITFVLPAYMWKPSGGYRVVYEYANQLAMRGHEVVVVHPRFLRNDELPPSPNFYQWLRRKAGKLRNLLIKPNISWWQPINKQVKMLYVPEPTSQYVPDGDAVFATARPTTEYVAEYPVNKGMKFYLVMDFDHRFGSQDELEASWKLPFKKVTISCWLYEQVVSVSGSQDTINIPLGIDSKRFRKIMNIDNRPKRIAMVCSLSTYKAVDDGIQALKICKVKYPDLQVTIFGNPRSPKIPSWIDFRYNVSYEELINIYNQSRIFICSSLAEGFAFPPAEAMSCGCAVASTDCGGNREYAIDGVTALLSPPSNPEELAKNVIRLLEDDNLRIKLANAGYKYIQQFTWERSTYLLEQFITENIKSKACNGKNDGTSNSKVSIIIVNWNGKQYLKDCLNLVFNQIYPDYDVILVDNGSTDGSVEFVKENYPYVRVIELESNYGFAKGSNIGIEEALKDKNVRYIALLNNDTIVKEDFLNVLMNQASKYPAAGIFCPKIYFYDRPDTIWFAGGYIDWKYDGAHRGYGKKDNHNYDSAMVCEYVTGCAMLIRREVIIKVGLLDESFFAYQEDVDFCIRARKAGYECMYIPYPNVWHKAGAASKKQERMSPFHRYLGTRNKLVVVRKNFGKLQFWGVLLRELFVVTPIYIILYSSRGHFDLVFAQLHGIFDGIMKKNKFLKK